MQLLFIDPLNSRDRHAAFNATIVSAAVRLSGVSSIYLLVEKSQLGSAYFTGILPNPKIFAHPFEFANALVKQPLIKIGVLQSLIKTYRHLLRVIHDVKPDIVFFLAADNFATPLAILAGQLVDRGKKTPRFVVVLHNNFENLAQGRYPALKKSLWRITERITNITFVVLVPFLVTEGRCAFPQSDFQILPHPTYAHLHPQFAQEKVPSIKEVDFLFLGRHAYEAVHSGFLEEFLKCCVDILPNIPQNSIGVALPSDFDVDIPEGISLLPYQSYPSAPEYFSIIADAKFAVIPDCSRHRLTASGVLVDLLTLGTPVIAPKDGAWLYQVAPGNQALLFDNLVDLRQKVLRALTMPMEEYRALSLDVSTHCERFDLVTTSTHLDTIFTP